MMEKMRKAENGEQPRQKSGDPDNAARDMFVPFVSEACVANCNESIVENVEILLFEGSDQAKEGC